MSLACSVVRKWTCNIFLRREHVLLKAQQYTFSSSGIEKYILALNSVVYPFCCRFVFDCFRLGFRLDIRSARDSMGEVRMRKSIRRSLFGESRTMRSSLSAVAMLLISFSIPLVAQGKLEPHSFTPDTHT